MNPFTVLPLGQVNAKLQVFRAKTARDEHRESPLLRKSPMPTLSPDMGIAGHTNRGSLRTSSRAPILIKARRQGGHD